MGRRNTQNDLGEWIALGGVMEQPAPGQLPKVHNSIAPDRDVWGTVKHVEVADGVYEEHITWQGPVHDFNRAKHRSWIYHGYGGTLVTKFNSKSGVHEPIKTENGNYILVYERVTEERDNMPWLTTTFMREMDPSLKFTTGPEIEVTNLISPKTGEYFQALRRGFGGKLEGYLREGDNVLFELSRKQYIKAGSANDYVGNYGIYLDYLEPGQGPIGKYKNVVDDKGELIDFATHLKLRELGLTWVGRPQLMYVGRNDLRLALHGVETKNLPADAPHSGWPTCEQFCHYGRVTLLVPVKITWDKQGQPLLVRLPNEPSAKPQQ